MLCVTTTTNTKYRKTTLPTLYMMNQCIAGDNSEGLEFAHEVFEEQPVSVYVCVYI